MKLDQYRKIGNDLARDEAQLIVFSIGKRLRRVYPDNLEFPAQAGFVRSDIRPRSLLRGFLVWEPDILGKGLGWPWLKEPSSITLSRKILSIGYNFALLRGRNAAIQRAGYQVVTTRESRLVVELAREQKFDAVVLCSSIPAHLRKTIARELRRLRSAPPLIVLCRIGESQCFDDLADEVVITPRSGSNERVIEAISRVTGSPMTEEKAS